MFTSFSEFKFFKSVRIPIESADDVRCMIEFENEFGRFEYIEDGRIMDVSLTGIGFKTKSQISVGKNLRISINFRRLRIDVNATVVRAFGDTSAEQELMYGTEIDEDDTKQLKKFIEQFVYSFSPDRARDCLATLALSERYKSAAEGFEIFSLMLSLFKDITQFGNQESFIETMLEEITNILNAQRASIFLINPQSNELEAIAALGINKDVLKFDYRKGIAGSVFTTGQALNIDCKSDTVRFSEDMDNKTGFNTKSIICYPISNREDKTIGVIEVLNKRNQDRFTVDDEKTMKVLALIFSSVFHNYNPVSEKSMIRRFSTPYDRELVLIGKSPITNELRRAIVRLKDVDSPLLISGEKGVGKKLLSKIIHHEGKRGLNPFSIISCQDLDEFELKKAIFGDLKEPSVLESTAGGTVLFDHVEKIPPKMQKELFQILLDRRIPGSKISLDVRVFFTADETINEMVEEGTFDKDLYNFFSTAHVVIDPLRKRVKDIEALLTFHLNKECRKQGLLLKEFAPSVIEELKEYEWPGNVSELQKVAEKAVLYNPKAHIITDISSRVTPIIDLSKKSPHALDDIAGAKDHTMPLKDRVALVEREMILAEIKRAKGNKSKAAKEMGISREALRKKLIQSDSIAEKLAEDTSKTKKASPVKEVATEENVAQVEDISKKAA